MTAETPRAPRIGPGDREAIGTVNALIARALGALAGSGPPNLFTTLARHRRLFRPWLRFAGALMPRGALPRPDSELLILRVAHNCACAYELAHHEPIARREGFDDADLARVAAGPEAAGWTARQVDLLRAADELHSQRRISDALWARLAAMLSQTELIELCMLVGHYEMLAMTLNSLAVEPDVVGEPGRLARRLYALVS